MIRSQLVSIVAGQFRHIRQRDVEEAVHTILDQIASSLAKGDRVELRGFGSFAMRVREARMGRNPKTGAPVHVPETRFALFRPASEIRKRLNPGAADTEERDVG